ncbi:MAG: elongation factor 1-beta [Candidatus Thermoplasmatota archaeon]|nr:elongation factor 1-beta [Candidatus Thermoplasmatota archaeon]MCL5437151.1 elongation factor 1-beta [Candidatus Thermoplasmatota archaeon]
MSKVVLTYRLMPDSENFDFDGMEDGIKSRLPPDCQLRDHRIVPIAFGLKSYEVMIVAEDREGTTEQIESALSSVPGIQSVESVEITLL